MPDCTSLILTKDVLSTHPISSFLKDETTDVLRLQSPRIPVAAYLAGHLPIIVMLCLGSFPEKQLVLKQ